MEGGHCLDVELNINITRSGANHAVRILWSFGLFISPLYTDLVKLYTIGLSGFLISLSLGESVGGVSRFAILFICVEFVFWTRVLTRSRYSCFWQQAGMHEDASVVEICTSFDELRTSPART